MNRRRQQFNTGFTLVELMVALLVASIIFAATATLSHATACAKEATDEMGRTQAQACQARMRLLDLIKRANQVLLADSNGFQLWHDTNTDGVVDSGETTWVIADTADRLLRIQPYQVFSECSNVSFQYDNFVPNIRHVAVWFDVDENGTTQRYSINAELRVSDDY